MRNLILTQLFILFSLVSFSQAPQEIKDGAPLTVEGIEFVYTLSAPTAKTIDGIAYSFYELKCDVTNMEKFSKIFLIKKDGDRTTNSEINLAQKVYIGKLNVYNGVNMGGATTSMYITAESNMQVLSYTNIILGMKKKKYIEGFNLEPGRTLTITKTIAVQTGPPRVSMNVLGLSPQY